MNKFSQFLTDTLIEDYSSINPKIIGLNLLEVLKIKLIENLIRIDKNLLQELESVLAKEKKINQKVNYKNNSTIFYLDFYDKSISLLKKNIDYDQLFIIIQGSVKINIFDKNKKTKSIYYHMLQNNGLVLCSQTIVNKEIEKNSIILTIKNT